MGIAGDYIKPFRQVLNNKHFRTWLRLYYSLKSKPARQQGTAHFDGFQITYADALSFIFQYKEIFVNEAYHFKPRRNDPLIIDCGANIGMGCLYFKKGFPQAKILAYEADPPIANLLEKNMQVNQLKNISVFQKAVWIDDQGMSFFSDGADGGTFYGKDNGHKVPTVRLRDMLLQQERVDFLKIDIEGAETAVIKDCNEALQCVEHLYVEYHSLVGREQDLSELLRVLEKNSFRYIISSLYKQDHPLIAPAVSNNMDLQLHVFAINNFWK